jgi:tetratricopeptide (TPR) repeat protein
MSGHSTTPPVLPARPDPAVAPKLLLAFEFLPLLILALLLTFLVYVAAVRFAFVYDDLAEIVKDPTQHSWRYLPIYFTSHNWQYSHPEAVPNYYRPLPMVWKLFHYTVFGAHPFWWHLSNIVVHTIVTLLVFVLARRITRDDFTAVASAFVFGLHPVHIEAVAWVSGITDLLLALLLVGAFILYLDWRATGPRRFRRSYCLLLSLLLYALGTLTKEPAIIFPGLIVFWEFLNTSAAGSQSWDIKRFFNRCRESLTPALPYLAVPGVYLVVRIRVLKSFSHTATPLPALTMVLTWPSLIWFYIKSLLWPLGLSIFYDVPVVSRPGLSGFVMPLLGVCCFGLLCWRLAKGSRAAKFALILMALPLVPVLNLSVFNTGGFAHDRFVYLPSIGFAILAGLAIRRLRLQRFVLFGQPAPEVAVVLCLAALFGVLTATQVQYWQDELVLYSRAVRIAPNNSEAANNLACVLEDKGMHQEALDKLQEVISRDPGYWNATYNVGYILYKVGNLDAAEPYLRRAVQMDPNSASANLYLGLVFLKTGHLDESEGAIRKALELGPVERGYYCSLGLVLELKGSTVEAEEAYKEELSRYDNEPEVTNHLNTLLANPASDVLENKSELTRDVGDIPSVINHSKQARIAK